MLIQQAMSYDAVVDVHAYVNTSICTFLEAVALPSCYIAVVSDQLVQTSLMADGQQCQGMHMMLQVLDTHGGLDAFSDSKTAT